MIGIACNARSKDSEIKVRKRRKMKSRELKKRENKWCYIVIFSSLASLFHSLSFHQLVSCFSPSHDTHPFSVYRLRMRHRDIPRGSNTDKTVVFVVKKKSEKRKWPALYFFFFFFNIAPPTFFLSPLFVTSFSRQTEDANR